jgi:ATP-dependent DNA helicase RecQ
MLSAELQRTLTHVFGFEGLRPGQGEVIDDVLAGRPTIAVMPTGAGKSLCYQLPAVELGRDGAVTLVVSPLIALMKDQVDSLRARGVDAAALTSAVSAAEQSDILAGIRSGQFTLVYVAPERFRSPRFLDALAELGDKLGLLAIDEAHCISEWGHEFRPDYRRLGEAVRRLRPPRLVALTATATREVRDDIAVQLDMPDPGMHVHGFDRPNIHYVVEAAGGGADKCRRLVDRVRRRTSGAALVYAATRKNAERYAGALAEHGMRVRAYHAGLDDRARTRAQDAFMAGKLDAVVATNAFGMGVDKSDIHLVIHADLPRSVEAYYQESGRGGRDGERTECALLFNHSDARLQEFLIDASHPSADTLRGVWRAMRERPECGADAESIRRALADPPHASAIASAVRILARHGYAVEQPDGGAEAALPAELHGEFPPFDVDALGRRSQIERRKLREMVEYGYFPRCRRHYMLDYFGDADWSDPDRRCNACDNCKGLGQAQPISDDQHEQVRALLGVVAGLRGRFGRTRIAAIANGTDDDQRFDAMPERGALRGTSARYIMDMLRALDGAGLVSASRGEYPTVSITRAGREVLAGAARVDRLGLLPGGSQRVRSRGSRAADIVSDCSEPIDMAVVERLRTLRSVLASEQSVPAYRIFSNKTLEAIARAQPSSLDELAGVRGIGPSRLDAYGKTILTALAGDHGGPAT